MNKQSLFAVVLLLIIMAILPGSTLAQGAPCADLVVDDSTSQVDIDVVALCPIVQQWTNEGFKVYVFITDQTPPNEDTWFSWLDNFEISQGIRNNQGFLKNAIAFEVSTSGTSFASNITIGEGLDHTPLWDDQRRQEMKTLQHDLFTNNVDKNSALREIVNATYRVAFGSPNIVAVQPVATLVPSVVSPTNSTSTNTSSQESNEDDSSKSKYVFIAVGWFLLLCLLAFLVDPIQSLWRRYQARKHRNQKINQIKETLQLFVEIAVGLTAGADLKASFLYQCWVLENGPLDVENDKLFSKLLATAQNKTAEAMLYLEDVLKAITEYGDEDFLRWSHAYQCLIGHKEQFKALSGLELADYINPMSADSQTQNGSLLEDLHHLSQFLSPVSLHVEVNKFWIESPELLPDLVALVDMIQELRHIRAEVDKLIEVAKVDYKSVRPTLIEIPDNIFFGPDEIVAHIEKELKSVDESIAAFQWRTAHKKVLALLNYLNRIDDVAQLAYEVFQRTLSRRTEVAKITKLGYLAKPILQLHRDEESLSEDIDQYLLKDNLDDAESRLREVDRLSEEALDIMTKNMKLHETNAHQLVEIQAKVLVLINEIDEKGPVGKAWATLKQFPRSNWVEQADSYKQVQELVQKWKDVTDDKNDLYSQALSRNALDIQDFVFVAQRIAEAYSDLAEAERLAKELQDRLKLVLLLKQKNSDNHAQASAELTKAIQRRDANNQLITAEVDEQLNEAFDKLEKAAKLMSSQEYTEAAQKIEGALTLVRAAYQSAESQIHSITVAQNQAKDNQAELGRAQSSLQAAYQAMPAAARRSGLVSTVEQALHLASEAINLVQRGVAGLEDAKLLEGVTDQNNALAEAISALEKATSKVKADHNEYQDALRQVAAQNEAAQSAISAAANRVSHHHANGQGQMALSRARGITLSSVSSGAGWTEIEQALKDAQQAERYAEEAKNEADAKIRREEQEEARQREEAERARKRREEEERRRRAASSFSSTSFSSGSRTSFGSRSSSSGSNFGASKR